jgi:hypothetical protein
MEKETSFSHADSLALIESMINKAKNRFNEDGFLYLLWGWVVLVCSIAEFVLLQMKYQKHYLVWILTWAAAVYQIIFMIKRKRSQAVRTYTDEIIRFVWLTFIISMGISGFLFGVVLGKEFYKVLDPVFLMLYGMPTFLTGIIIRFKPLITGGICCWVLSILSVTLVPIEYGLLLVSAAMVVAWITPGYLLRVKHRKTMS